MPFIDKLTFGKEYKQVGNHFELSKEYLKDSAWKFKKITATRLCSVLGMSKWNTPFKTWCVMVNIFKEDMDPIVANVGTTLEPEIRKFVNKQMVLKTGINFKYSFYDTKVVNYDCWKGIDEVFGGIPDGEPYFELPPNNNQDISKLIYDQGLPLLEIKTSSIDAFKYAKDEHGVNRLQIGPDGNPIVKEPGAKKLEWFNNQGKIEFSTEYKYQIGLYMYLRHVTKGILAVCFVDTKNYTHPKNQIVGPHNTYAKLITFDPKDMEADLQKARDWYYKYIKTGVSPEMTDIDRRWLEEQSKIK